MSISGKACLSAFREFPKPRKSRFKLIVPGRRPARLCYLCKPNGPGIWLVLGLTEAIFGLSIRKIVFDHSASDQQPPKTRSSGFGIGFTLGPAGEVMAGRSKSSLFPLSIILIILIPFPTLTIAIPQYHCKIDLFRSLSVFQIGLKYEPASYRNSKK